jgi:predicted Zn-dependent protease
VSETIEQILREAMPKVDFCSMRYHRDQSSVLAVRQNILMPMTNRHDQGVMVTVHHKGGVGYGATSDLRRSGIAAAVKQACAWAETNAGKTVVNFSDILMPSLQGEYRSKVAVPWKSINLSDKIDRLMRVSASLPKHATIVDWSTSLWNIAEYRLYLTNHDGRIEQDFSYLIPDISVSANRATETVTRSMGGRGHCGQGGMELLESTGFDWIGPEIADDAVALLSAPVCPSGKMDVLLAPDQMMLQIHESIGHPLELDRILGDERNFAGTSFVTLDMFGNYRYGSELLNISYDPTMAGQIASYGFDDDGSKAEKTLLIDKGILKKPLGGAISQARANHIAGVANSRSVSWKRPAIDRMANLNLEPGKSSVNEMISSIENGVYMKSNNSWSIDDSRNKFQFGCEWGQKIEGGKLTHLVKKPNYRGISASFWRSLRMTGNRETFEILGTPYCGKGEPGQAIRVGHATPACVFSDVDVFGGE